jgi:hypothetical protein
VQPPVTVTEKVSWSLVVIEMVMIRFSYQSLQP